MGVGSNSALQRLRDPLRCLGGYDRKKAMNGKLDERGTQACKLHAMSSLISVFYLWLNPCTISFEKKCFTAEKHNNNNQTKFHIVFFYFWYLLLIHLIIILPSKRNFITLLSFTLYSYATSPPPQYRPFLSIFT